MGGGESLVVGNDVSASAEASALSDAGIVGNADGGLAFTDEGRPFRLKDCRTVCFARSTIISKFKKINDWLTSLAKTKSQQISSYGLLVK